MRITEIFDEQKPQWMEYLGQLRQDSATVIIKAENFSSVPKITVPMFSYEKKDLISVKFRLVSMVFEFKPSLPGSSPGSSNRSYQVDVHFTIDHDEKIDPRTIGFGIGSVHLLAKHGATEDEIRQVADNFNEKIETENFKTIARLVKTVMENLDMDPGLGIQPENFSMIEVGLLTPDSHNYWIKFNLGNGEKMFELAKYWNNRQ
jgi:hypothetical protein